MNSPSFYPTARPPLFVFRIIANRAGLPAGLLAEFGSGNGSADAVAVALALADAVSLGQAFPCFYRDGGAGDPTGAVDGAMVLAQAALGQAALGQAALGQAAAGQVPVGLDGWAAMAPGALWLADDKLAGQNLPEDVQWIAGEWCMAPPPRPSGTQAASRVLALQLVQLVMDDADTHEIEALLRRDPTLSYQLLRLVNSLGMGVVRRISSFSQALMILGRQQLRRWLNLMLFAARQGDPRSPMLLARVAVRARALELLARARGMDKLMQEQAFMTGMFSLLGVLFGMALPALLAPLSISEAVQGALLRREGELGALLRLVETAEHADFGTIAVQLEALQLGAGEFNATMVEATRWMLGAMRETEGMAHA